MTLAHGIVESIDVKIPRMRGIIHAYASPLLLVAGTVMALHAHSWRASMSLMCMTLGYVGIFFVSSLYHMRHWNPQIKKVMRRVDHSMIFIGMASVYTALWILVLDGGLANALLAYVWVGAFIGVLMKLKYIDARASRHALAYIAFGLVGLAVLPSLTQQMPLKSVVMLLGGSAVFVLGAVSFSLQKPNPFPKLFGHHEIFHASTVIGAVLHLLALASVAIH